MIVNLVRPATSSVYLAKLGSYHLALKNCRYDLDIKTGGYPLHSGSISPVIPLLGNEQEKSWHE
jgi:hypothetical protein